MAYHLLGIWLRRAFQLILCLLGKVPVHVAFVMDGNRRYAERQHVDKATGHTHGYGKMVDVIHWCIELGVKHITVYAFSIDNFKRSSDEVTALMRLAEEKYAELAQDNGLAEREGIQMHIVGDLQLPPPAVQGAAARLMRGTAALRSRRAVLNVCFSYTASEESVAAVHELQAAVRSGQLAPDDVTPAALAGALRTGPDCPPVDLLIRTSGETRLSDFLLWQASHAHLAYLTTLWPDLSYWHFARCVMSYQRHAGTLAELRRRAAARLAEATGRGAQCRDGGSRQQEQQQQQPQRHGADTERAKASHEGRGGVAAEEAVVATGAGMPLRRRGGACEAQSHGVTLSMAPSGGSAAEPAAAAAGTAGAGRSSESQAAGTSVEPSGPLWLLQWPLVSWRLGFVLGRWPALWGLFGGRGCGGGVAGAGGGVDGGREVRLLRFFERLEQARLAWVAAHADL